MYTALCLYCQRIFYTNLVPQNNVSEPFFYEVGRARKQWLCCFVLIVLRAPAAPAKHTTPFVIGQNICVLKYLCPELFVSSNICAKIRLCWCASIYPEGPAR